MINGKELLLVINYILFFKKLIDFSKFLFFFFAEDRDIYRRFTSNLFIGDVLDELPLIRKQIEKKKEEERQKQEEKKQEEERKKQEEKKKEEEEERKKEENKKENEAKIQQAQSKEAQAEKKKEDIEASEDISSIPVVSLVTPEIFPEVQALSEEKQKKIHEVEQKMNEVYSLFTSFFFKINLYF